MTIPASGRGTPQAPATAAAATLALIAGLHVAWAHGSSVPFRDRASLHDAVLGGPANRPSSVACYTVAVTLAASSTAVLRASASHDRPSRLIAQGVALTLAARAIIGFAGMTERYMPGATSNTFRRLDRRIYSPLCMTLAIGAALATRNAPRTSTRIGYHRRRSPRTS